MTNLSILCGRCFRQWIEHGFSTEHSNQGRRCPWPRASTAFVMKNSNAINPVCNGELSIVVRRARR